MTTVEPTVAKTGKKKTDEADYSTFRILAEDGEDLSALSAMTEKDMARTFRKFLAPVVRKLLAEKMKKKLGQLESPEG